MLHQLTSRLAITALLSLTSFAIAGPKVKVGRAVSDAEQVPMDRIDHGAWAQLLSTYVNEQGQVDYRLWKASQKDLTKLDDYLAMLSTASLRKPTSKKAQLAFWINAYNAVTVKGILREYPTTSIKNHLAMLYGYNIWKDLQLLVGGHQVSLEQIEHEVLRKMGEPRIHFAIVCASHSCPRLLNDAYTAEKLETQLRLNAKAFFANHENFRYDQAGKRFFVSRILDWFAPDFGRDQAAQLEAIAPYLPTTASKRAARANSVRVSYLKYDWNLNSQ